MESVRKTFKKHSVQKVIILFVVFAGITFFVSPTSLILLNGTTCSGKSTTAKCLVELLRSQGKKVVHISIDDYMQDLLQGLDEQKYKRFQDVSPFKRTNIDFICDVFNQMALSFANEPSIDFIVIEHCFFYESFFCCSLLRFKQFVAPPASNVFFIKIHCTYETALERLQFRNSVPGDSNRQGNLVDIHFGAKQFGGRPDFHANKIYDLEIDSTNMPPEECAKKIIDILSTDPMAFGRNYTSDYWTKKIESLYSQKIIDSFLSEVEFAALYSCF